VYKDKRLTFSFCLHLDALVHDIQLSGKSVSQENTRAVVHLIKLI